MGTTDLTKNATDQQEGIHMSTSTSNDGTGSAPRNGSYSGLPNKLARAANGIDYAYRDTAGGEDGVPLV